MLHCFFMLLLFVYVSYTFVSVIITMFTFSKLLHIHIILYYDQLLFMSCELLHHLLDVPRRVARVGNHVRLEGLEVTYCTLTFPNRIVIILLQ